MKAKNLTTGVSFSDKITNINDYSISDKLLIKVTENQVDLKDLHCDYSYYQDPENVCHEYYIASFDRDDFMSQTKNDHMFLKDIENNDYYYVDFI